MEHITGYTGCGQEGYISKHWFLSEVRGRSETFLFKMVITESWVLGRCHRSLVLKHFSHCPLWTKTERQSLYSGNQVYICTFCCTVANYSPCIEVEHLNPCCKLRYLPFCWLFECNMQEVHSEICLSKLLRFVCLIWGGDAGSACIFFYGHWKDTFSCPQRDPPADLRSSCCSNFN